MSDELLRMRDENRELKKVINDRDLQKKQLDVRMFEESQSKLADAEKRNEVCLCSTPPPNYLHRN